jgi:hypothetical protein
MGHNSNAVIRKHYLDSRANVDLQSLSQNRKPNDFKDFRALENERFPGAPCLPEDRKRAALDVQELKDLKEERKRLQSNGSSKTELARSKTKIDVLRARLLNNARKNFRAEWRRTAASRGLSEKEEAYSPKSKTALHPLRALVVDLLYKSDGYSVERDLALACALRDLCLYRPGGRYRPKSKGYLCCETNCIRHLRPFTARRDMDAHWKKNHDLNLVGLSHLRPSTALNRIVYAIE